jgi:hypothetical protein
MAVQLSNPCPACNKKPDIPGELWLPAFAFMPGSTFFCNHCGTKLEVAHKSSSPIHGLGTFVSAIPSDRLIIRLWMPPTKKAFVSYSHKDDAFCHPFADALKAEGFDVFLDNGSIGSGADWVQAIGKAIDECHFFIAVLTPDAWGSEWVERELNTAIAARRTIIPVLLKDTSVQGILRSVQWVDVRSQTPEQAAKLVAEAMKKAK